MIRLAIIGVGNCSCSLAQSIVADSSDKLRTGLAHITIGGYRVSDIKIVAAFDVDTRKVGIPFHEAIFADPNCTTQYVPLPNLSVNVSCGSLLDGVAPHMKDTFLVSEKALKTTLEDVVSILKSVKADVVISYLPVGSHDASKFYARAALESGCAFVNCMPSLIANDETIASEFKKAGLPLLGDDIKSQIGSTSLHRALISLLEQKGVRITSTYQLNIGGNTDFKNMRNPDRAMSKKHTKESSLKYLFHKEVPALGVGPSDYVPHLKDNKVAYINILGEGLLGMPFSIELKLNVEDSPNSAGVAVNAIRAAKVAKDRKLGGVIDEVCSALFKLPTKHIQESVAMDQLAKFSR